MREQLQEIASTISRNKLRTFLTGFSVAWGIFMLIVLLGSGNGLRNAMQDSFGDLAVNSMQVYGGRTSMPYKGFQSGRNITPNLDDIQVLTNEFPDQIDQIAASVYHWGANLAYGREYNTANLYGVTPKFPEIKGVRVTAGRFINETDIKERRKVVVLDDMTSKTLFKGADPIGKVIQIDKMGYTVVGLYKGNNYSYTPRIYSPISTVFQIYMANKRDVGDLSFTVKDIRTDEQSKDFKDRLFARLGAAHTFSPDDKSAMYIWDVMENYKQGQMIFNGIALFIWIIGIGTLIAGIVGVSNIMLVTVRERTFEFGIRKAMGAKERTILAQFVTEAATTSALGGTLGIVLGYIVSAIANQVLPMFTDGMDVTVSPSFNSIAAAFGISVFIGVLFGYLPAKRAARLNPIDALRYD